MSTILSIAHLIGMALAVGSATVKLAMVLKCQADSAFVQTYLKVARPITRQIILGMILVTLSGIGWLLLGYPFTPKLVVKLVLVGTIWIMGPIIDNVIEPKFKKLAPESGEPTSPAFIRIQKQYLAIEAIATLLFYIVIVVWMLG